MADVSGHPGTIIAWIEMKIAECDREVAMAKAVGMEAMALPFARDALYFRATLGLLANLSATATSPQDKA